MEPYAEAEKMAALKRAYADVILNTAKESAARILASEGRALRFQQSLFEAKDEALAMLLRLKSLTDSKIKEAETTSLSQVRRIQELEGQLSEAEHTIVSLREELERASNELKKTKSNLVELSNENKKNHASLNNGQCQESRSPGSNLPPLVGTGNSSTIDNMDLTDKPREPAQMNNDKDCHSTGNAIHDESLKPLPLEKECGSNPDLASIIMRNKEPELYRNRCTQRIRAFEHNALTAQEPHERKNTEDVMNESVASENGRNGRPHDEDSAETVKVVNFEAKDSTESIQSSNGSVNGDAVDFFSRASARRPRTRSYLIKCTGAASSHDQDVRCHKPSDADSSRITAGQIHSVESISEEPPIKMLKSATMSTILGREVRRRSSRSFSKEKSVLLPCTNGAATEKIAVKRIEAKSSPYSTKENDEHDTGKKDEISSSSLETKDGVLLPGNKQEANTAEVDTKLTSADHCRENLDNSSTKDALLAKHPDSKVEMDYESHEALPEGGKDKFLKYTFQRTRKRGLSSGSKNESILPDTIISNINSVDKQNVSLEPEKPTLDTELPRNNRRLMQVARQLISLSEKKW